MKGRGGEGRRGEERGGEEGEERRGRRGEGREKTEHLNKTSVATSHSVAQDHEPLR